ncbi:hypothetical protein B296_00057103 [Ensete ventricosum]|uniref:Uncharacterized protein n=1 Tax=Ensete ventricosum TaxID=4639 RepID=A0A426X2R0_ENSVE|nr:hypothetical protein B296_00057103 [Ensete ventricosum]
MTRSYWELHFSEQHNDKRAMDSRRECHGTTTAGLPCVRMIGAVGELDCFIVHIRLREPGKSENKAEQANVAPKEAKENKIGASSAIGWQRPCMRVAVCLSIDQAKLLREHSGVEASNRKGQGSDDESRGA